MKYPDRSIVYSRLYHIYQSIKQRCYYPKAISYKRYGARGIVMCDVWKNDFMSFYNWAIANGYSDELTIDRINSNGNYEPSNCRWIDYVSQANNRKTNVRLYYNGESHTIAEWSNLLNISRNVLYNRKKKGWSDERTLTTPIKTKYTNN